MATERDTDELLTTHQANIVWFRHAAKKLEAMLQLVSNAQMECKPGSRTEILLKQAYDIGQRLYSDILDFTVQK